jgi:protein YibB
MVPEMESVSLPDVLYRRQETAMAREIPQRRGESLPHPKAHGKGGRRMSDITIVSAFFDIGRGKWPAFARSRDQYLEYFRFWARVRNRLVVYTDRENGKDIRRVRAEYDRESETRVIEIDDIADWDRALLSRIGDTLGKKAAVSFRAKPNHPESYNPVYNYLTYLKPFFVKDALERGLVENDAAWIDFGYNHGGKYYVRPGDFDFRWSFDTNDKMHCFAIRELDDAPIFEIIRKVDTYITAGLFVGPRVRWIEMCGSFRRSIDHLLSCGMADDEQTLLLMAYRENPDSFQMHRINNFFEAWKLAGGDRLSIARARKYKRMKQDSREFWRRGNYIRSIVLYFNSLLSKIRGETA